MDWHQYFIGHARHAATKSKDPNQQVGAAIASNRNVLLATGFNGFPIGVAEGEHWADDRKAFRLIHAEDNAFITVDRTKLAFSRLYVTKAPCGPCGAKIVQHFQLYGGPMWVICPPPDPGGKWLNSQNEALAMLREVGITVTHMEFA